MAIPTERQSMPCIFVKGNSSRFRISYQSGGNFHMETFFRSPISQSNRKRPSNCGRIHPHHSQVVKGNTVQFSKQNLLDLTRCVYKTKTKNLTSNSVSDSGRPNKLPSESSLFPSFSSSPPIPICGLSLMM